jgi:urocanate hydratase
VCPSYAPPKTLVGHVLRVVDGNAGMIVVADGTGDAARRLERVLTIDPGTGIMRHADAGYDEAIAAARRHGIDLPGITT